MSRNEENNRAILRSAKKPNAEQIERFRSFLKKRYGRDMDLVWEESLDYEDGFVLVVGSEMFNWSYQDRLRQLKEELKRIPSKTQENIIPLIRNAVEAWKPKVVAHESGSVVRISDGIAVLSGLEHATYGEVLIFEDGTRGMVQELKEDSIGCILFEDSSEIHEGTTVRRTGRTAGIPVGEDFLGRAVNPLGVPIDGKGAIQADDYRPVEHPAPGIIDRQPVNEPMETGLLAIDAMFPIGRGQRELIIGDRQTGKTAIALDTIVNQKGKDVICIYVAIGQKASSVAQLMHDLERREAMDYTIIVNASASEAAPLQYIAPYAGCSLGEYFMEKGRDVLIVFDDLSKHAVAYRSMSLLLERSPGREAYPGDVFYLHSRLLERSAHLSEEKGGGSMTALPIIETQAGDVSAYIPTNVISITDGQIFLESDLFFSGQRPAVNVGLSVSRVGGDAQTKGLKKAASSLRLDLAQFREMEVFTQFSSDLDETTARQIRYGKGLMEMLKQNQYSPYQQHEQIIILVVMLNHLMENIPAAQITDCIREMLDTFHQLSKGLCEDLESEKVLTDEIRDEILVVAKQFIDGYMLRKK